MFKLRTLTIPLSVQRSIGERTLNISVITSDGRNQVLREKLSQIYFVYKNLAWIFLGAKASLGDDNRAPIGHSVFATTNGNKKETVRVMATNNLTFMSKCISKNERSQRNLASFPRHLHQPLYSELNCPEGNSIDETV
jgi:hypothetical protein